MGLFNEMRAAMVPYRSVRCSICIRCAQHTIVFRRYGRIYTLRAHVHASG